MEAAVSQRKVTLMDTLMEVKCAVVMVEVMVEVTVTPMPMEAYPVPAGMEEATVEVTVRPMEEVMVEVR